MIILEKGKLWRFVRDLSSKCNIVAVKLTMGKNIVTALNDGISLLPTDS